MWSNTDKGQLERCDQIQINQPERCDHTDKSKMWSNTDNGQLERCDQYR